MTDVEWQAAYVASWVADRADTAQQQGFPRAASKLHGWAYAIGGVAAGESSVDGLGVCARGLWRCAVRTFAGR